LQKENYAQDIYRIKFRKKILKSAFEFEYLRKLVQIICAVVLLDRGQQYDPIAKRINYKGFIEFELY
jgi:hypothetical protein